jgi:hypothetical protein
VETARVFIEQNKARLPKVMKVTGAQHYKSNDITALSFSDPSDEARHIAELIQSLYVSPSRTVMANAGCHGLTWQFYYAASNPTLSPSRRHFRLQVFLLSSLA